MRNLIVLLVLWSGVAWGQQGEWSYSGRTGDGDSAFVQLTNIQKVGSFYHAWTRLADSTGACTLSLCEFDLKKQRMRELKTMEYDAHGNILNNGTGDNTWTVYPPGSFVHRWMEMISLQVNKKGHE